MPKKRSSRIYWRNGRAWLDVRDYSDVINAASAITNRRSGFEPLVVAGEKYATKDPDIASQLAAQRVAQLERRRRDRVLLGHSNTTLAEFAAYHLKRKATSGRVEIATMEMTQRHLEMACDFFGADRDLATIGVRDVQDWVEKLYTLPGKKTGSTVGGSTVRKFLNSLSNLYRRAQSESLVPPGFNPVGSLMEKPVDEQKEADFLQIPDAAKYLHCAGVYTTAREFTAIPFFDVIVATLLLTGGREAEVLGLDVDDISFDRKLIYIRENKWRRLKTKAARRNIPMWPQLEEYLRRHVFGGDTPGSGLLFLSTHVRTRGEQRMITDLRKRFDTVGVVAGFPKDTSGHGCSGIRTPALVCKRSKVALQCHIGP